MATPSLIIQNYVQQWEQLHQGTKRTSIPSRKRGKVVRVSSCAPPALALTAGKNYLPTGRWYPELLVDPFGKRTIFGSTPFSARRSTYYLELKGYGRDGQEIWLGEHPSGDVAFGMYLKNAQREFELMERAAQLGLPVVLPIAVIHIPRNEYIKSGLYDLQRRIATVHFGQIAHQKKFSSLEEVAQAESEARHGAAWCISRLRKNYSDLEQGIDFLYQSAGYDPSRVEVLSALKSGRELGYLIRASKCPLRVGDPREVEATPRNKTIARNMGRTFRVLLEKGYLHHCPGTGNWTRAGELTDFADVFDLKTEWDELKEHMKRIGMKTFPHFLRYLIGEEHCGVLSPYFAEGMYGKGITPDRVVSRMVHSVQGFYKC